MRHSVEEIADCRICTPKKQKPKKRARIKDMTNVILKCTQCEFTKTALVEELPRHDHVRCPQCDNPMVPTRKEVITEEKSVDKS